MNISSHPLPKLLAISGSLRSRSYSTAILETLRHSLSDLAYVEIFRLNDIPVYNEDLDTNHGPEPVARLRSAIADADGLIIASPEYNAGMSGALKNTLDWSSRPYGRSTLKGKPVMTLTCSPASTGGARAQAQLNETLAAIEARIIVRPQAVIGSVHSKIDAGQFKDAKSLQFLREAVCDLLLAIERDSCWALTGRGVA